MMQNASARNVENTLAQEFSFSWCVTGEVPWLVKFSNEEFVNVELDNTPRKAMANVAFSSSQGLSRGINTVRYEKVL